MTEASAVQPERRLGRDAETRVEHLVDATAARVFTAPLTADEHVVMTASAVGRAGDRHQGRGRSVAVITAGPDGVHVRPVFGFAKIGLTALAAAAVVWCATRRT